MGRLPGSSPTWQLAQMAVLAGPSRTPMAEPASHISPMVGVKAPHRVCQERSHEETPEIPAGDSGLHESCQYQKSKVWKI